MSVRTGGTARNGAGRPAAVARGGRGRGGFSVVEVLVAVVMLGISAAGLAGMAFWAGRHAAAARGTAARDAALASTTERVGALSFEGLAAAAGCHETDIGADEFLLCVRVQRSTELRSVVTVFIDPANPLVPPDSAAFERARATPASPFQ